MKCPVCEGGEHQKLLHRPTTPVFQNAVFKSRQSASQCDQAELDMHRCNDCGFVWNAAFDDAAIGYSEDYENCQSHSSAFVDHLRTRSQKIFSVLPDQSELEIVEVGCGQGHFLTELVNQVPKDKRVRATGFDPALREELVSKAGAIRFVAEYLSSEVLARLEVNPDIIISRHTIEHVADPVEFLRVIRAAIPAGKTTHLFLETPDSGWILDNRVYHDFFYEHCSLFDFRSMSHALDRSGFTPVSIESCFDGQYLWTHAVTGPTKEFDSADFSSGAHGYTDQWRARIIEYGKKGGVAVWGAGAKGVTFALMVDPQCQLVKFLIDSNPQKAGGFVPLTAHPIVSPRDLPGQELATILIMNENYQAEITRTIKDLGLDFEIVLVR